MYWNTTYCCQDGQATHRSGVARILGWQQVEQPERGLAKALPELSSMVQKHRQHVERAQGASTVAVAHRKDENGGECCAAAWVVRFVVVGGATPWNDLADDLVGGR